MVTVSGKTRTATPPMAVDMEAKVAAAATLLRLVANETRLQILCRLIGEREVNVGSLVAARGLSQSALWHAAPGVGFWQGKGRVLF
jgi:hypothetical protein